MSAWGVDRRSETPQDNATKILDQELSFKKLSTEYLALLLTRFDWRVPIGFLITRYLGIFYVTVQSDKYNPLGTICKLFSSTKLRPNFRRTDLV